MVNPFSNKISVREAREKKVPLKTLQEQMHIDLAREEARREYERGRQKRKLDNKRKLKARRAMFASVINSILCTLSC